MKGVSKGQRCRALFNPALGKINGALTSQVKLD